MKTYKNLNLLTALLVITILAGSCVQSDDFDIPDVTVIEPNITANTTFKAVKERFDQQGGTATFDEAEPLYIEGYVISSDKAGNFFEELVIQNKIDDTSDATDPRMGLRIDVDVRSLYETFEIGRKIYIKLNGLSVGESNGVLVLGKSNDGEIDQIPNLQMNNFITRSAEVVTVTPKIISLGELSDADINTLIQLENMQFSSSELGKTYAGEADDEFDGERFLESCSDGSSMVLSTSTFADFKSITIPETGGTITAVYSKNYFGDSDVLLIRDRSDLVFSSNRCQAVFEENFDNAVDNSNFDFDGWTNFAEAGGELWTEQVFGGNGYTEFSAYQTGDDSNIGWLITPGIDMDSKSGEVLTFKTAQHHLDSTDNILEVFVSTNFDGTNVLTATWESINATLATINDSWYNFIDSGSIDLSSYSGTLYVAFKYTGSGTNTTLDGGYFVDDVKIVGQ